MLLDGEKPHFPKKDPLLAEEGGESVSTENRDVSVSVDCNDGVDGFREGRGEAAGVTYE